MSKNKICIITSAHPAFDVRIFHKQAVSLKKAGYDLTLVAPHAHDETVSGVRIKALPKPHGRLGRFVNLWRPLRAALAERADIYHIHDPDLIIPALILKIVSRAKVVYDVHEDVPKNIMSKYWIPRALRWPVAKMAGFIETIGSLAFNGIITATPAIARRFPKKKTIIVQNMPIIGELQAPNGDSYAERPPIIAYVGGLTTIRCIREMIEGFGLLPDSLGAKLALAGEFSPPELESEVRRLAHLKAIDFLGWQNRSEVGRLLGKSRIGLVLFYPEENHVESQPNKLFEYMSVGLPIIASDFPLWREIVDGAACGLLVDSLNPRAISEAMKKLINDPVEAEAMGRRGREAVVKHYNWELELQTLLKFYSERLAV